MRAITVFSGFSDFFKRGIVNKNTMQLIYFFQWEMRKLQIFL